MSILEGNDTLRPMAVTCGLAAAPRAAGCAMQEPQTMQSITDSTKPQVAAGDYNSQIDQRIAAIQSTCRVP